MSDPKKPVLDEQALGKLLEAAFVLQEHRGLTDKKQPASPETHSAQPGESKASEQDSASKSDTIPAPASGRLPAHEKSSSASPVEQDAYTLVLARIVETQQQILARGLELGNAMGLVAQRAAEITKASGAAIGIVENHPDGKKLQYRAVTGVLTLAEGSEVAMEKALGFNCLRSGEVTRCADVNSDFLLDAEDCRRRGIASLIAVPIYRDRGIAGALEVYFSSANAFSEQDVHSSQLLAGLVTEAFARDAGASSRKSLAAERATMLEALEKLRPNLAALMESPALNESAIKSAAATAASALKTAPADAMAKAAAAPVAAFPAASTPVAAASSSSNAAVTNPAAASPAQKPAPVFRCRKCGHDLVGEEMFCGKCGSPRTTDYEPPTMQSKLAAMWHKQQALNPAGVPVRVNGSANAPASGAVRAPEPHNHAGFPEIQLPEIQPWEAVLSELQDPFGEPEATRELESERDSPLVADPTEKLREEQLRKEALEALEIAAAAKKFSAELGAPTTDASANDSRLAATRVSSSQVFPSPINASPILGSRINDEPTEEEVTKAESEASLSHIEDAEADEKAEDAENAEKVVDSTLTTTALATASPLTWSSAAKAREAFEQLAASRHQTSFLRFWNARRGDIYLAIAVVLVAGVVRWSITSDHSFGAAGSAKTSHRRPAPDADLSTFDKLLISLGLAESPDPPEEKGNPDTQVWVDLHSALYYCPGADMYGKTPQGKYTSQRDAQLGQFEPAYRKVCN